MKRAYFVKGEIYSPRTCNTCAALCKGSKWPLDTCRRYTKPEGLRATVLELALSHPQGVFDILEMTKTKIHEVGTKPYFAIVSQ